MPSSWIGRLNIIKIVILLKVIYRFNSTASAYQFFCLIKIDKLFLKIFMKIQRS